METMNMAIKPQPKTMAPVRAQCLRNSSPTPNKNPKNGAILMLPVASTNQVLKNIGKNIVMPNRIKVQSTASNNPVLGAEIVRDMKVKFLYLSVQK